MREVIIIGLLSPIYFFPLVIIYCMRPWLLIRFRELDTCGIGGLALPFEIYLCEVACGLHNSKQKRVVDIWYPNKVICNKVLMEKWRKKLRFLWPWWLVRTLHILISMMPGGGAHRIPYRDGRDKSIPCQFCDIHNVLNKTKPQLTFSSDEEAEGSLALQKMGIKEDNSIICFIARDSAYDYNFWNKHSPRNSSVHLMLPAVEKLVTPFGYKAIRMGSKVNETFKVSHSSIIDYAD